MYLVIKEDFGYKLTAFRKTKFAFSVTGVGGMDVTWIKQVLLQPTPNMDWFSGGVVSRPMITTTQRVLA